LAAPRGKLGPSWPLGQFATDPDAGALRGIAVTGLTGTSDGTSQFSTTDGRTWLGIGAVSDANALLLRDTDRIRFRPGKDFNGTATLTYQAWDRTRGTAGARSDLTAGTGGTTPYSIAAETASVIVTPVDDAPVLNIKPTPTDCSLPEVISRWTNLPPARRRRAMFGEVQEGRNMSGESD
jgi:hypothetical protein